MKIHTAITVILCAVLGSAACAASEVEEIPEGSIEIPQTSKFKYRGTIYQGWTKTSDNRVKGPSDERGGSFESREIGLSASYTVNDHVDFRGMVQHEVDGTETNNKLLYGLADLHNSSGDGKFSYGTRLGRVKLPMGMMNDTRDDPILRDMDIVPQGLYRDQFKHMAMSGDGVQFYMSRMLACGNTLSFEYTRVRPTISDSEQDETVNVLFSTPKGVGRINNNASNIQAIGVQLAMPHDGWLFRYDRVSMNFKYEGNEDSPYRRGIPDGRIDTTVNYLSARKYFMNGFDVTGEILYVERSNDLWDKLLSGRNYGPPMAYNLMVRYRPDEHWTFYGNYNVWYTDIKDKSGVVHASNPGNAPPARYSSKDLNFGFKYLIDNKWAFKASYHIIHGTNTLSIDENESMKDMKSRYNMINASVSYAF